MLAVPRPGTHGPRASCRKERENYDDLDFWSSIRMAKEANVWGEHHKEEGAIKPIGLAGTP